MMHICKFFSMICFVMMDNSFQDLVVVRRYSGWHQNTMNDDIDRWSITTVTDRIVCDWRCFKYLNYPCYGVTYNNNDSSCRLNMLSSVYTYKENSSYEISLMKPVRVCKLEDDSVATKDVINWTVDNATKLCETLDLQLMTYNELDTLREEIGYNSNDCGYALDGFTTRPKAYTNYVNETVGMVNCTLDSAVAFCKDPLYA